MHGYLDLTLNCFVLRGGTLPQKKIDCQINFARELESTIRQRDVFQILRVEIEVASDY
jgi:hypothetical protein